MNAASLAGAANSLVAQSVEAGRTAMPRSFGGSLADACQPRSALDMTHVAAHAYIR